jgi:hypothetical protein
MGWRARLGPALAWLPWALAATAVAIGVEVAVWNYLTSRPARPTPEPAWSWDRREAPVILCLSGRAPGETVPCDKVNVRIEGTISGFGDVIPKDRQPIDSGNVIGCRDEPQRYIDVQDGDHQRWRVLYALDGLAAPRLRAPIGTRVRLRFDSAFYAGQTTSFMLSDDAGPLIGAVADTFGPRPEDAGPFSIGWGRVLESGSDECAGRLATRALRVSGDTTVRVLPDQTAFVYLRGVPYRFWNAASVEVTEPACPDMASSVSWILWRT